MSFAFAAEDFRDSEISNLDDFAFLVEKNVLRLQVAMQDLFGVHVLKREQELTEEPQDLLYVLM